MLFSLKCNSYKIIVEISLRKVFNLLIQLAESDKHFASQEHDLLIRILKKKGFPESFYDEIKNNPESISSLKQLPAEIRFEYVYYAVELIYADSNVYASETLYCKTIARQLGFNMGLIDYFLQAYGHRSHDEIKAVALERYS
jgi:uncharacterized tellurite resistance protein B-like protein